jgi:OmcA/MtrC family decaheme c-type cytochrome
LPAKDASTFTNDDLNNIIPECRIISAFVPAKNPIVNFQVTNKATGKGISGLRTFGLHVAKLMPESNGSNSYWVNYIDRGISLPAPLAFTGTANAKAITGQIIKPAADPAKTFVTSSQNGLNLTTYPVGSVLLNGYTVIDHGDGTYTAVFGSDITSNANAPYESDKIHRIGVTVTSIAVPGVTATGPVNPLTNAVNTSFLANNRAAVVYDFVPATGLPLTTAAGAQTFARDIVTTAACNQCHYSLAAFGGHFARWNTQLCVICHTNTNTSGEGEFVTLIHRIHRGEELPKAVSAESVINPTKPLARTTPLITYSEVKFPQDARNCTTCHKGLESTNWKTKPSRKACGACHNNIDFATGVSSTTVPVIGTQHVALSSDQTCAGCHSGTSAPYEIAALHIPVAEATSSTSGVKSYYADNSNLPAGAFKIEYAINSVNVDADRKVSVKFQIKKDGNAMNFGTYNATTNPNLIPNTVGGPSMRIAYNVTQDNITSPADTNAYMSIPGLGVPVPTVTTVATPPGVYTAPATTNSLWVKGSITASGITWTLSGPDSTNNYTITSSLPLPASTTMVTAFMYGSMTQTNLNLDGNGKASFKADSISDFTSYLVTSGSNAGKTSYSITKTGLILCPPNASKSVTTTGFTARRTIVDNAKCQKCHVRLGLKPNFHGGARNDGTTCNICHTPNSNSGGWSYGFNTFIHGIHGKTKRSVNYTFGATSATEGLFEVAYPGILKNCEQCHVSGGYDFSASANAAAVGKQLYNTVATGVTAAASYNTSPYIAQSAGTDYGSGFSYATTSGAVVTTEAAGATLVSSPISAACFACHDTSANKAHMVSMGGSIYEARSSALAKTETCLTCHGTAANAVNATVPTIKAVHRWW